MALNLTQAAELMKVAREKYGNDCMSGESKPCSGMDWKSYTHNILWQMDYDGNHRLIQVESWEGQGFQVGEWAPYISPAILGEFMIFTSFYTNLEEKLLMYRVL